MKQKISEYHSTLKDYGIKSIKWMTVAGNWLKYQQKANQLSKRQIIRNVKIRDRGFELTRMVYKFARVKLEG